MPRRISRTEQEELRRLNEDAIAKKIQWLNILEQLEKKVTTLSVAERYSILGSLFFGAITETGAQLQKFLTVVKEGKQQLEKTTHTRLITNSISNIQTNIRKSIRELPNTTRITELKDWYFKIRDAVHQGLSPDRSAAHTAESGFEKLNNPPEQPDTLTPEGAVVLHQPGQ